MYTDEDKVFCVKRMWAEGLTPTAASRLWGAPSRRTLAAWEKEALGGGLAVEAPRVPGACRRAKHARYPEETRAEALRLLGLGKPTREIARALGLPSGSVVSRWAAEARRRAKMAPEAIAMGKEKGAPGPVSVNIIFTIFTNVFSPIAPTRMRRIRQRGCAAFGA